MENNASLSPQVVRLKPDEIKKIKDAVSEYDKDAEIYIFGSSSENGHSDRSKVMTQKDYLEILSKSLRDLDKSSAWLKRFYQKCRIIGIKGNYDETELEAFETIE